MATILRSSATGKVSEGTTTTVPASRSSGSRSWNCRAKRRWSASNGTLGAAMVDMAEVNQARDADAPLDFVESGALYRGLSLFAWDPASPELFELSVRPVLHGGPEHRSAGLRSITNHS